MRVSVVFMAGFLAFGPSYGGDAMSALGGLVAPNTQSLILDDQPLTEDAVLATLDILSEQVLLGPGSEKFPVREGQVTVGKPLLYALARPKLDGARLIPLPGDKPSTFYLVVFRFTLEPAPGERRYKTMQFEVALSDPQTTAFKLMPERVVSEEDVKESYDIGFTISLPSEKAGPSADLKASATQTVGFVRLVPEVTAFGSGTSLFHWQFTGHGDVPLAPGTRTAAAVIQVPQDTKRLSATITWDINLERSRFEKWFMVPTKVNALPVELPLL